MTDTTTNMDAGPRIAVQLVLTGRVQGMGVRPAVARFAQSLSLVGFVGNTQRGVEIHVEGRTADVDRFERELRSRLPAATKITSVQGERAEPTGCDRFVIGRFPSNRIHSVSAVLPHHDSGHHEHGPLAAHLPPDVVVCDDCVAEVQNGADRRHGYPFASCTDCGPRYSIIERMPYERAQSSMAGFPLCDRCRGEYTSPSDRRFHAQTNACPDCGPQIWLRDVQDRVVAHGQHATQAAAAAIRDGRTVALRGLGGYQLLVDATSQAAVERLRRRKQRHGKPLAVMLPSLEEAAKLARLGETEQRLLRSPAGPIVIAAVQSDVHLASAVTAGLNTIGLMLPTTPLHWLLLDAVKRPLVCTSGNIEGDPLSVSAPEIVGPLNDMADLWLEHDRPIRRPIDDSVVRLIAGRPVTIRLARGYAPLPLDLKCDEPLIALGGHQKASIALFNGAQAVLGPHIGDLGSVATRQRFVEQLADLSELYGIGNSSYICDLHPEYFTTNWGKKQTDRIVRVQHHHAHVAAGMLEHGWLDRQVLGVSFDGTGYGVDGTIWGGEFLLAKATGFERVGHLRQFSLPGGERAVRQPWRVATALVREANGDEEASRLNFQTGDAKTMLPLLQSPRLSQTTTSAGRLFDGVATLVLGIERCAFEGQAAMLLESACDVSVHDEYDIIVDDHSPTTLLDWRPLVRQILHDRDAGVPPSVMAMRFHRALASAVFQFCRTYRSLPVVLGGGVFQNRVLVELLAEHFAETEQPLGLPGLIPPNDGGLAAGQLAVTAFTGTNRCPAR